MFVVVSVFVLFRCAYCCYCGFVVVCLSLLLWLLLVVCLCRVVVGGVFLVVLTVCEAEEGMWFGRRGLYNPLAVSFIMNTAGASTSRGSRPGNQGLE